MADPLSITAGVVAILSAAAQISSLVIDFSRTVESAPSQAQVVITEVNDISGILPQLRSFLTGNVSIERSRAAILQVDQVVSIVSSCLLTFSELERLIDGFRGGRVGAINRLHWARNESKIQDLVQRMQTHKASLSLILTILNG